MLYDSLSYQNAFATLALQCVSVLLWWPFSAHLQRPVSTVISNFISPSCSPKALYREISSTQLRWKILLGSDPEHLPSWSRHIRTLRWKGYRWTKPLYIDFEPLYPILERLQGLKTVEYLLPFVKFPGSSRAEELTNRIISLEAMRWEPPWVINETTAVRQAIFLSLYVPSWTWLKIVIIISFLGIASKLWLWQLRTRRAQNRSIYHQCQA